MKKKFQQLLDKVGQDSGLTLSGGLMIRGGMPMDNTANCNNDGASCSMNNTQICNNANDCHLAHNTHTCTTNKCTN